MNRSTPKRSAGKVRTAPALAASLLAIFAAVAVFGTAGCTPRDAGDAAAAATRPEPDPAAEPAADVPPSPAFEPAYPQSVSTEGLSDDDKAQQEAGSHQHADGTTHSHGPDEEHEEDDGAHDH